MQYHQEQIALGSVAKISIVSDLGSDIIMSFFTELWRTIFQFERKMSRFIPASELSMFNRNSGIKQIISPEFRNILIEAKNIAIETKGLYNPFILPALQNVGYKHSMVKGYENDTVDDFSNRTVADVSKLEIGDDWAIIPFGTALDLGGCGKGYLADKLSDYLKDKVDGYWISLGGDIICGGHDGDGNDWEITLQDAFLPERYIGKICKKDHDVLAVATSGVITRKGKKLGKAWHHLIDPTTLKPAKTDVLIATVVNPSAFRSDVLASCAVILGSKAAPNFLKNHEIYEALLQCVGEKKEPVNIQIGKNIKVDADV